MVLVSCFVTCEPDMVAGRLKFICYFNVGKR